VDRAESVARALELVQQHAPDLVLLGVGLRTATVSSWRASCARARRRRDIFLTAQANPEDRVRGLELSADDYVSKPFNFREFAAACRTASSARKAWRSRRRDARAGDDRARASTEPSPPRSRAAGNR
jgi:DNA-binding response OmpR family regulator